MDTRSQFHRIFSGHEWQQVKMEEKAMKKSTELIWFFVQAAILAAAYAATGFFPEGGEGHFEIITLDETSSCMV